MKRVVSSLIVKAMPMGLIMGTYHCRAPTGNVFERRCCWATMDSMDTPTWINSTLPLKKGERCVQVNNDKPPLGFINISAHHQHQLNENFAIDQKPASCHHHHGVKALKNSL